MLVSGWCEPRQAITVSTVSPRLAACEEQTAAVWAACEEQTDAVLAEEPCVHGAPGPGAGLAERLRVCMRSRAFTALPGGASLAERLRVWLWTALSGLWQL